MTTLPVSPAAAAAELLRRRAARTSLHAFTEYTFPAFQASWHHTVMCRYLDRFVSGDIKRLMIFAPPRHTKSELVSRRLPALIFGVDPDATVIAASYGADLARRMNRDVQRIMDDDRYLKLFPDSRLFGKNIRTVAQGSWLRNSDMFEIVGRRGYYLGSGVGGSLTGSGASRAIIDDPVKNRAEANSATYRENVWDWYTSTLRTRLTPDGGILLTCTRWHQDDLAGRLLAQAASEPGADQWAVVAFPAIAEEPIAEYDVRRPGEALWPARWDEQKLGRTRLTLGTYDWNSLYQQRPRPREGGMVKREWLRIVPGVRGDVIARVRYWDKAGSTSVGAKFTAGVKLSYAADGVIYIEHVVHGKWSTGDRRAVMLQTAQTDGTQVLVGIEQEPGSSGLDSVVDEQRLLVGYAVFADRPSGDKDTRMLPFVAQAEALNVRLVAGDWNADYIEELCSLPNGTYRDQADATSGALNRLREYLETADGGMMVIDENVQISPY